MNPKDLSDFFSRQRLSGGEAALVLALLFGPHRKRWLWRHLARHRDTLHHALVSLVRRGFIAGNYGRGRANPLLSLVIPSGGGDADGANPPHSNERQPAGANQGALFLERSEAQRRAVLKRLRLAEELVRASPLLQDRAEALARRMFKR